MSNSEKSANKLYFKTRRPASKNAPKTHYWVLLSPDGFRLGVACENFPEKIDAVRNAIEVLGRGVWVGDHDIPDELDYNIVVDEGIQMGHIEEVEALVY